jgi:hypothetical protein
VTPDITIVITPALTKARIIRRMASTLGEPIDESLAQELASDLHELVADFRQAYRAQPPRPRDADVEAIEEADVVDAILRNAVGLVPEDGETAMQDACWVDEQLIGLADLYERFVRIRDAINGTDIASLVS